MRDAREELWIEVVALQLGKDYSQEHSSLVADKAVAAFDERFRCPPSNLPDVPKPPPGRLIKEGDVR